MGAAEVEVDDDCSLTMAGGGVVESCLGKLFFGRTELHLDLIARHSISNKSPLYPRNDVCHPS